MSRIAYNTGTPLGQLIAEGVDHMHSARLNFERAASAASEMTAEQCEAEIGVSAGDFNLFRNHLNDILAHLQDKNCKTRLVIFDQG